MVSFGSSSGLRSPRRSRPAALRLTLRAEHEPTAAREPPGQAAAQGPVEAAANATARLAAAGAVLWAEVDERSVPWIPSNRQAAERPTCVHPSGLQFCPL
jgi:hypothetical protein